MSPNYPGLQKGNPSSSWSNPHRSRIWLTLQPHLKNQINPIQNHGTGPPELPFGVGNFESGCPLITQPSICVDMLAGFIGNVQSV